MSKAELNCSWNFPNHPKNGSLVGPNEPMAENFKKTPYASIVREAIQNSLDERLDSSSPLEMSFSIKELTADNFPNFFDIEKHIQGCLDFYKDSKEIYKPMLDYLKLVKQNRYTIPYIQISDYNANGMPFNTENHNDPQSPFVAFVRAAGLSTKRSDNAGGSFGFGKAAYFYLSPIRTILVSTLTKDGNCYFEGVSSLCTHKYENVDKMAIGYYDSNNGLPISDNEAIPRRFRRLKDDRDNRPGTDIYIMGLKHSVGASFDQTKNYIYYQMKVAVLRNFWMAIFENNLIVTIGDTTINKDNLLHVMEDVFSEEDDTSRSINDYNPLPYLKMIIAAKNNENNHYIFRMSEDKDNPLHQIVLYLQKKKTANDRIIYMRSPKMVVKAENKRNRRGYYGTFVCTGGQLDALLRAVENPAHNEWHINNYDKDPSVKRTITQLLEAIFQFVRDKVDSIFASNNSTEDSIKDLEQYLYIPTEEDDDDDFMQESIISDPTGEFKNDGTSLTTDSDDIPSPKLPTESKSNVGVVLQPKTTSSTPDPNGDRATGHGGSNSGNGGSRRGTRKVTVIEDEDKNGENTSTLHFVPVRYRSFAQIENGKLIHNIIIHSDFDIPNGRIDLLVGTEENNESIDVVWTDQGTPRDNTIIDLKLNKGTNRIKFSFADDMKHSVNLEAYEIK